MMQADLEEYGGMTSEKRNELYGIIDQAKKELETLTFDQQADWDYEKDPNNPDRPFSEYVEDRTWEMESKAAEGFGHTVGGILKPAIDAGEELTYAINYDAPSERQRQESAQRGMAVINPAVGYVGVKAPAIARGTGRAARAAVEPVRTRLNDQKSSKIDKKIAEQDAIIDGLTAEKAKAEAEFGIESPAYINRSQILDARITEAQKIREPQAKAREQIDAAAYEQQMRKSSPAFDALMRELESARSAQTRAAVWAKIKKLVKTVGTLGISAIVNSVSPGSSMAWTMAKGAKQAADIFIQRGEINYGGQGRTTTTMNKPEATVFDNSPQTKSPVPETQTQPTATMEPIRQAKQPETTVTVEPMVENPAAAMRDALKKREGELVIEDIKLNDRQRSRDKQDVIDENAPDIDFKAEIDWRIEQWIEESRVAEGKPATQGNYNPQKAPEPIAQSPFTNMDKAQLIRERTVPEGLEGQSKSATDAASEGVKAVDNAALDSWLGEARAAEQGKYKTDANGNIIYKTDPKTGAKAPVRKTQNEIDMDAAKAEGSMGTREEGVRADGKEVGSDPQMNQQMAGVRAARKNPGVEGINQAEIAKQAAEYNRYQKAEQKAYEAEAKSGRKWTEEEIAGYAEKIVEDYWARRAENKRKKAEAKKDEVPEENLSAKGKDERKLTEELEKNQAKIEANREAKTAEEILQKIREMKGKFTEAENKLTFTRKLDSALKDTYKSEKGKQTLKEVVNEIVDDMTTRKGMNLPKNEGARSTANKYSITEAEAKALLDFAEEIYIMRKGK